MQVKLIVKQMKVCSNTDLISNIFVFVYCLAR